MLENRRDEEATQRANFHDPRSYISFAGHYYLEGRLDKVEMREKIYDRAHGFCQLCGKRAGWFRGEWHHAQDTRGGRRCDGLCCGRWLLQRLSQNRKTEDRRLIYGSGSQE